MIRWRPLPALLGLSLLTFASVAVHGYHLAADDADIYLPAVKKIINPGLYPFGNEFFQSHAKLSQFAAVVAASARLTHSSGDLVFFLWHIATVFLFLLAIWQLATVCFESARARWSGTIMIAALLTVPAAGTALVIMDPYLTARSASSPFSVFAVAAMLSGRRGIALLWLALVAFVHPQMAFYTALFLAVLLFTPKWTLFTEREQAPKESEWEKVAVAGVALIPGDFGFGPLSPDYRRALQDRTFMFLYRWTWYECMGVAAPLALLYWLGRDLPRGPDRPSPALPEPPSSSAYWPPWPGSFSPQAPI